MKIAQLDNMVKELIEEYSVYGVECLINAIARNSAYNPYINMNSVMALVDSAYNRVASEMENEND